MSKKESSNIDLLTETTEENSIITLFPCDYDSSEENDYANSSQDSIDSSELVDDSDEVAEIINEIQIFNKKLEKTDEKSIITA